MTKTAGATTLASWHASPILLIASHTLVVCIFFLLGTKIGVLFGAAPPADWSAGGLATAACAESHSNHLKAISLSWLTGGSALRLENLDKSDNDDEPYTQLRSKLEKHAPRPPSQQKETMTTPEDNAKKSTDPPVVPKKWQIPYGIQAVIGGVARVKRDAFLQAFDAGLPYEDDTPGNSEILLLYDATATLPKSFDDAERFPNNEMPLYSNPYEATENCKVLRVVHVDASNGENREDEPSVCLAIQGQATEPHYHVHKWIQQRDPQHPDQKIRYKAVGRYHTLDTRTGKIVAASKLADPPKPMAVDQANKLLQHYISIYLDVMKSLAPIAQQASVKVSEHLQPTGLDGNKATVIVMICNAPQLELLVNLACALRALGTTDLQHYLVFAMDEETHRVASQLGFTAFYEARLFEKLVPQPQPSDHSADRKSIEYGTVDYALVMMAKLYVTHLISVLKCNFIFHDIDILPYQSDYLRYLTETIPAKYPDRDLYMQYDHSTLPDYQPWSANSGFYYARHNERTSYFFSYLLRHGDVLLRTRSHQATMNMVLSDVANQYGLYIKVLRKESNEFPVGYQFHKDREYMQNMMQGKLTPKAFHMNWNNDKDTKRKFFQQMGAWHVQDQWSRTDPESGNVEKVCVTPQPVCYFRDKPSKLTTCTTFPSLEDNISFW